MAITRKAVRIGVHVLLFLVAIVIFYLGLGVGLAFNPALGTLLWIVAFVVAGLNMFWILHECFRR